MADPIVAVDDDLTISFASLLLEIEEPVGSTVMLKGLIGPAIRLEVDVPFELAHDLVVPRRRASALRIRPILMLSSVMLLGFAALAIVTEAMWGAPELSATALAYALAGTATLLIRVVSP